MQSLISNLKNNNYCIKVVLADRVKVIGDDKNRKVAYFISDSNEIDYAQSIRDEIYRSTEMRIFRVKIEELEGIE